MLKVQESGTQEYLPADSKGYTEGRDNPGGQKAGLL